MEIPKTEGHGQGEGSSHSQNVGESFADLFLRPKVFFSGVKKNMAWPMSLIVMFLYFIAHGIDSIDQQLLRADFSANPGVLEFLNSWLVYWGLSLSLGVLGGVITYFIYGWFYNLRIKFAGGTSAPKIARKLVVYAGLINSLVVIFITVLDTFMKDGPIVNVESATGWGEWILLVVTMTVLPIASMYSIYISYRGVTTLTDVLKKRAMLWFLILPMGVMGFVWLLVTVVLFVLALDSLPF